MAEVIKDTDERLVSSTEQEWVTVQGDEIYFHSKPNNIVIWPLKDLLDLVQFARYTNTKTSAGLKVSDENKLPLEVIGADRHPETDETRPHDVVTRDSHIICQCYSKDEAVMCREALEWHNFILGGGYAPEVPSKKETT